MISWKQSLLCAILVAALLVAAPVTSARAAETPEAADVTLLNRVTWGANEGSETRLRQLGPERWLQWQLHPTADDTLPPAIQAQIDALPISQRPISALFGDWVSQSKAANGVIDLVQKQAAQQAFGQAMNDFARQSATRDILRDLYSPTQLRERMTWFWFNHFNVHQYKSDVRPMLADYQETTIRPNALGHFRDLLMATLQHPAMLRYLDNADNSSGRINENYAREIMELHSMGVDSGYTQNDVQELARILTGVGIDARPEDPKLKPEWQSLLVRRGLFEFNPARHDFGDKLLLGHVIKGRGFAEVEEAVAILSGEPATARHVSEQLATYFVSDTPSQALVDRLAQAYTQSDGDIPTVLMTLFHSPDFAAASKFKDPMRYVLSAIRLAYNDRVILNTAPVQNWLNRLAEGIYNHETPDGYSMQSSAWNGPGQMVVRFEIARQIGSSAAGMMKPPGENAVDHPGYPLLQNAIYFNAVRQRMSRTTLAVLDQAISPQDWNLLFLSSPEFMY